MQIDDESPKAIWDEMVRWAYDLPYEDAVAGNDVKWTVAVMRKLKNKR